MNRKRRSLRTLIIATTCGVLITCIFHVLLVGNFHDSRVHSFAVIGLAAANDLVWNHLNVHCYAQASGCYIEELGVNTALYTLGLFLLLSTIDLLMHMRVGGPGKS